MSVATRAQDFCADHTMAGIDLGADVLLCRWGSKAGPTAARVVLCFRTEQLVATSHTLVRSLFFRFVILAREWPFGSLLPRNRVLLRRKLLSPFFLSLGNFLGHLSSLS